LSDCRSLGLINFFGLAKDKIKQTAAFLRKLPVLPKKIVGTPPTEEAGQLINYNTEKSIKITEFIIGI